MRIDSGVLLVGKTSDNTTDVGVVAMVLLVTFMQLDNIPLVLNRKTRNHGIIKI